MGRRWPPPRLFLLLIPLAVAGLFPPAALGWGGDGHRVVARVAELRLSDQAKAGVKNLLGNATLVDVAAWADDVSTKRRETAPWHFVDIPVEAGGYDPQRDGRGGDNVVDAIGPFRRV